MLENRKGWWWGLPVTRSHCHQASQLLTQGQKQADSYWEFKTTSCTVSSIGIQYGMQNNHFQFMLGLSVTVTKPPCSAVSLLLLALTHCSFPTHSDPCCVLLTTTDLPLLSPPSHSPRDHTFVQQSLVMLSPSLRGHHLHRMYTLLSLKHLLWS